MAKTRRSNVQGLIYLLHFSEPDYHARHYLGWTEGNVTDRLDSHMAGSGSKLMQAITEQGISVAVARLWAGTRNDERKLKKQKHGPRLCPICRKEREHEERALERRRKKPMDRQRRGVVQLVA